MSQNSLTELTPSGDDRALKGPSLLKRWFAGTSTYIFLLDVAIFIAFGLISQDHIYWTYENIQNIMTGGAQGLLLGLGVAILMAAGIFDLSLGASLVLSSMVGAMYIHSHSVIDEKNAAATATPMVYLVGFLLCIGTGIVVGLVNGYFITKLRVNALIATLGMLSIASGVAFVLNKGSDISGLPQDMTDILALRTILGVPAPAVLAVGVAIIFWLIIKYTKFGMETLAIGSSRVAGERAGLYVDRHHLILLVTVGGLCGIAGFMDLSRFASTAISGHANDGLAAVTAAVIGGTALAGGRTSVMGVIWGTVLSIQLLTGLLIIDVPPFYQLIATGGFLVIAVWLDGMRRKKRDRRY